MGPGRPLSERRAAFANRAAWIAPLGTTSYMIAHFDHLGVVEAVPGPATGGFPTTIEIEDQHRLIHDVLTESERPKRLGAPAQAHTEVHVGHHVTRHEVAISGIDKFRRFPLGMPVRLS